MRDAIPTPPDSGSSQSFRYLKAVQVTPRDKRNCTVDFKARSRHSCRSCSPSPSPCSRRQLKRRGPVATRAALLERTPVPPNCYKKMISPESQSDKCSKKATISPRNRLFASRVIKPVSMNQLGYRGFSAKSQGINSPEGFVAGAFKGPGSIPECPDIKGPIYRGEAERHVGCLKDWPTPFISLTKNPIRAISRAFAVGRNQPAFVTIVDMTVLCRSTNVQAAGNLDLNPRNTRYDAGGEFLICKSKTSVRRSAADQSMAGGLIPKSAIIAITAVETLFEQRPYSLDDEDLLGMQVIKQNWKAWFIRCNLAKKNLELNHSVGVAVGVLARIWNVPSSHLDAAVGDILRDWSVRGHVRMSWKEQDDFLAGLEIGYIEGQTPYGRPGPQAETIVLSDDDELPVTPVATRDATHFQHERLALIGAGSWPEEIFEEENSSQMHTKPDDNTQPIWCNVSQQDVTNGVGWAPPRNSDEKDQQPNDSGDWINTEEFVYLGHYLI